jgi:phospholipase C
MPLRDIETIVFLMLENRSFDHAIGYLSTANANPPIAVEGLRDDPAWRAAHANTHAGTVYPLHALGPNVQSMEDPPHDSVAIALQIGRPARPSAPPPMNGFVESYITRRRAPPSDPSLVMGYYTKEAVPMFDFFARNYVVCDHWFAALPTGTQPNRLMAMSGSSSILDNASVFLASQPLVYDWLTAHGVSWCAYQWGNFFPFFSLMPHWIPEMMTSLALPGPEMRGRFRRYRHLREHWLGAASLPQVIFVEPEYTDGPHVDPNDDHPPTGIAKGQALLADLYGILTSNVARWRNTLLIVTYDEHGGFFDHVPPLPIPANAGGTSIATTGLRVPAFLASPHVAPGVPFTDALDHTSFLQLLADRFNPGQSYSAEVSLRQTELGRLSTALTEVPSGDVRPTTLHPTLPNVAQLTALAPRSSGTSDAPSAARTSKAFWSVAQKAQSDHPDLVAMPGWAELARHLGSLR